MPVPAAGEPHVFPGNAHPLEVPRRGEHPPHQVVVVALDAIALRQGNAGFRGPAGQAVADRLQLPEVENARRGGSGLDPMGDFRMAERVAEEVRQLPLQAGDLTAQLQTRLTLVNRGPEPGKRLSLQ